MKTRLFPAITPAQAVELHTAFVDDMLNRFRNLDIADLELHTDIETDAWIYSGVPRKLQITGHLGLKLFHALDQALRSGYARAVILGSDAPTLPVEHVRTLLASNGDIALGPAGDGGFYAIAARRVHPSMFDGVVWSRSDTMAGAIEAISRCGLSVELGPAWFDVDEPADLDRLFHQPDLPPHTAACLERVIAARRDTC